MTTEQAIQRLGSTLLYYNLHGEIKSNVGEWLDNFEYKEDKGDQVDISDRRLIDCLSLAIAIIKKRGM